MEEFPGVLFHEATVGGRRAVLVDGPEVWDAVCAIRSGRGAEPELTRRDAQPGDRRAVRARGHDAVEVVERRDLVSLPDEEVLALGAQEGRVVATLNIGDFVALDARWKADGRNHAGLVLVPTRAFPLPDKAVGRRPRRGTGLAGSHAHGSPRSQDLLVLGATVLMPARAGGRISCLQARTFVRPGVGAIF